MGDKDWYRCLIVKYSRNRVKVITRSLNPLGTVFSIISRMHTTFAIPDEIFGRTISQYKVYSYGAFYRQIYRGFSRLNWSAQPTN